MALFGASRFIQCGKPQNIRIFYEHPGFTFEEKEAAKPFSLPVLRTKAQFTAIIDINSLYEKSIEAFNRLLGILFKKINTHNSKEFLEPVLELLNETYPQAQIFVRANSGFTTSQLYDLCRKYGIAFVIRLKSSSKLRQYSKPSENLLKAS